MNRMLRLPAMRRGMLPSSVSALLGGRRRGLSSRIDGGVLQGLERLVEGPALNLETGRMANQTHAAVVGTAGSTVVLTTVSTEVVESAPSGGPSNSFLTVEYRERHHAVGRFPKVGNRRDNRVLSLGEVLASRAVDRSLRPVLQRKSAQERVALSSSSPTSYIGRRHVLSSLQALTSPALMKTEQTVGTSGVGDPVALAINSAAAALDIDVAAVSLSVGRDGTVVQDASLLPGDWIGHLLYAGTREECVMMEWGALPPRLTAEEDALFTIGLADELWPDLLHLAQQSLQSRLDTIDDFRATLRESESAKGASLLQAMDESVLRASLGLSVNRRDAVPAPPEAVSPLLQEEQKEQRLQEALKYTDDRLRETFLRLFGWTDDMPRRDEKDLGLDVAQVSAAEQSAMLPKSARGKREAIVKEEVERLVQEFMDKDAFADNEAYLQECSEFAKEIYDKLVRKYFCEAVSTYGCRSDGRGALPMVQNSGNRSGGWNTVRPVTVTVPALPDAVHGSALFSRGETRVLCTVTLAPPAQGVPDQDPFETIRRESGETPPPEGSGPTSEYQSLPVGSLRFLKTQEALVSDLNSRKVQADKERTGDSGSLAEVRRALLQYDFPGYSTGEVPSSVGQLHNRRALGHGALAEKAILPVLPTPQDFPYAIRMTSEVTDSNGSSSMATVCGSTMALLDAGVPIVHPVAGVSVGLSSRGDSEPKACGLALDITGTEDYFGAMDFKIAGTADAVTALQLDVKVPVNPTVLAAGIQLSKAGRRAVLASMESQSEYGFNVRPELKDSAPRVEVVRFDPNRKRDLIGPGGVILRQLEDRYSVSIDLTQEGSCLIFGDDRDMVSKARSTVMDLVADVQEGEVYEGTIVELKDFGALVELLRNKEGILHVSELTNESEAKDHPEGIAGFVRDFLKVGQTLDVLCTGVDPVQGSIKLSRKALLNRSRRQKRT